MPTWRFRSYYINAFLNVVIPGSDSLQAAHSISTFTELHGHGSFTVMLLLLGFQIRLDGQKPTQREMSKVREIIVEEQSFEIVNFPTPPQSSKPKPGHKKVTKYGETWPENTGRHGQKIRGDMARKYGETWPENTGGHGQKIRGDMARKYGGTWPENTGEGGDVTRD